MHDSNGSKANKNHSAMQTCVYSHLRVMTFRGPAVQPYLTSSSAHLFSHPTHVQNKMEPSGSQQSLWSVCWHDAYTHFLKWHHFASSVLRWGCRPQQLPQHPSARPSNLFIKTTCRPSRAAWLHVLGMAQPNILYCRCETFNLYALIVCCYCRF